MKLPSGLSFISSKRRPARRPRRRIFVETLEQKVLLAADLTLASSDGDISVQGGDTITYTYEYGNVGDEDATGVSIHTQVPRGTALADGNDDWTCENTDRFFSGCKLEIGDVGAGETGTATMTVVVADELPPHVGRIENMARIHGTDFRERNLRNNTAHESTPIDRELADLTISLSDGEVEVAPGESITYEIDYANIGSSAAEDAVVSIYVPAHTTLADGNSDDWLCERRVCKMEVGAVGTDEGGSATLTVTVNEELPLWVSRIHASAAIVDRGTNGHDANPRDNRDSVTTSVNQQGADLTLDIDDGDVEVAAGGTINYDVSYANEGDVDALGALIQVRLSRHTTADLDASSEGWACEEARGGTVCTLDVGDVGAGAAGTSQLVVNVNDNLRTGVRRILTAGRIKGDGGDTSPFNNFDYASTEVARDDGDDQDGNRFLDWLGRLRRDR